MACKQILEKLPVIAALIMKTVNKIIACACETDTASIRKLLEQLAFIQKCWWDVSHTITALEREIEKTTIEDNGSNNTS